ncbi:VOC family protein [Gordonia sp. N1V]|uniref:VOC family protein n=1 Tax=Gordonia sp. N1V TaxID=3034163 RepID=UPI0023E1288B|nr:VOC family protein [Gordonia sp. N1V]MDF3281040.1 VOC family protein [Gordonia sp. N1V]
MTPEVTSLGYLVITAEDLPAWREFAESILGLQVTGSPDGTDDDALYLRVDERSWRIAVEPGSNGGVVGIGLEVSTREALDSLRKRLANSGTQITEVPELAARRGVLDVFTALDPSGHPIEFFYGAKSDREPFVSPRGAHFVTGTQGLGHIVLFVDDHEKTREFYVNTLGFRVSDMLMMGPDCSFTSPNPRHHTVAFVALPGVEPALQHLMLEVDEIDAVGRALDRVVDNDVPLSLTLGRHTNDHMLSFYCESPSGVKVEYGYGGMLVGGDHTTGHFDAASVWGHRPPPGAEVMDGLGAED